jgi:LasA protease
MIDAEPNPVPAGGELGTTTIKWRTADGTPGQVYVSEDDAAENLFASGPEGSERAPWIRTGTTYEFRLYAGTDRRTQLAVVKVTRAR